MPPGAGFDMKLTTEVSHGWEIRQVEFSPGGQRLAASGVSHLVTTWDVASLNALFLLQCQCYSSTGVSWSPKVQSLLPLVRKNGRLIEGVECTEPISGCDWASDEKSVTLGSLDKPSL
ncbi:hypothetical protein PT974_01110 [Cladobotryum mycophilum]|uniref:Uncharacterized protein n=1 Tax=Cladobotryum mycophilum TaxID=491253 RepID=A0ABR0T2Q7_9HYPO